MNGITLTGAFNRRSLDKILAKEINEANNRTLPLSLMALDLDFFKVINDDFGHSAGDKVLQHFYQACLQSVHDSDYIIRTGGEEFIILLPTTTIEKATDSAQRLRQKIEELTIEFDHKLIKLTVSIGVTQWNKKIFNNADEFIKQADINLYHAKNSGRNCVSSSK